MAGIEPTPTFRPHFFTMLSLRSFSKSSTCPDRAGSAAATPGGVLTMTPGPVGGLYKGAFVSANAATDDPTPTATSRMPDTRTEKLM